LSGAVRRGLPRETKTIETIDAWTVEPATGAVHCDEPDKERAAVPMVAPHAQVPVGVWKDMIRLTDRHQFWIRGEAFIVAALAKRYNERSTQRSAKPRRVTEFSEPECISVGLISPNPWGTPSWLGQPIPALLPSQLPSTLVLPFSMLY
jgi:hypothetical protein